MKMTKMGRVLVLLFMMLGTASLGACGGGSEASRQVTSLPPTDSTPGAESVVGHGSGPLLAGRHQRPRGLTNFGDSCFINASLQVIANSQRLRAAAIVKFPEIRFAEFFRLYDNIDSDPVVFEQALRLVVQGIRGWPGVSVSGAGSSVAVLNNLVSGKAAAMSLILSRADILADTAVRREVGLHEMHVSFADGGPVLAGFAELHMPPGLALTSFIYFQGSVNKDGRTARGHLTAYVYRSGQWYSVDDQYVQAIPHSQMAVLPERMVLVESPAEDVTAHLSGIVSFSTEDV